MTAAAALVVVLLTDEDDADDDVEDDDVDDDDVEDDDVEDDDGDDVDDDGAKVGTCGIGIDNDLLDPVGMGVGMVSCTEGSRGLWGASNAPRRIRVCAGVGGAS